MLRLGARSMAIVSETPRRSLREPIPQIFEAAGLLSAAVDAHLEGDRGRAATLFRQADMPAVREYTESLWGRADHPDRPAFLANMRQFMQLGSIPAAERDRRAKPTTAQQRELHRRWGWSCAFCGIPLVRKDVRDFLKREYPDDAYWRSNRNLDQHAALQCMWVQYDHAVPHRCGGATSTENLIVTCAPCNYGRNGCRLEDLGLRDPRDGEIAQDGWDGLERVLGGSAWTR